MRTWPCVAQTAVFPACQPYYEPPVNPDLDLNTGTQPLRECVNIVVEELWDRGIIF